MVDLQLRVKRKRTVIVEETHSVSIPLHRLVQLLLKAGQITMVHELLKRSSGVIKEDVEVEEDRIIYGLIESESIDDKALKDLKAHALERILKAVPSWSRESAEDAVTRYWEEFVNPMGSSFYTGYEYDLEDFKYEEQGS